jgi:hypothetical protein
MRNFTVQQWADIIAHLPKGASPTHEATTEFAVAANVYWEGYAAPSVRKRLRLLVQVINHVRAAVPIDVAIPHMKHRFAADLDILAFHRDACERAANRPAPKKMHREEFLKAAIKLWFACGGGPGTSWSGEPSGPLIRYLRLVCDLVMGAAAPAPETLRAFARKERRRL